MTTSFAEQLLKVKLIDVSKIELCKILNECKWRVAAVKSLGEFYDDAEESKKLHAEFERLEKQALEKNLNLSEAVKEAKELLEGIKKCYGRMTTEEYREEQRKRAEDRLLNKIFGDKP